MVEHPALKQFFAYHRFLGPLVTDASNRDLYYITDITGQFNLWRMASYGGVPQQMTGFSEHTVRSVAVAPVTGTVLVTADYQGRENQQLYRIAAAGSWPQQMTFRPEVQWQLSPLAWDAEGSRFTVGANDRELADMDVLIWTDGADAPQRLWADGGYNLPVAWSPDGRWILVVKIHSNTNTDCYVLEVASGEPKLLTPHNRDAQFIPGPWSRDGRGFYLLTNAERDFTGLYWYGLDGERRAIAEPEGDVEQVMVSPNGRRLAWTVNEDGSSRLYVSNLGGAPQAIPVDDGVVSSPWFSPGGDRLYFYLNAATRPQEIWCWDRRRGMSTLTRSQFGGLGDQLVNPEHVTFPSFDGREIPALWYRPRHVKRFPVLLWLHGGPESQERPHYSGFIQALVASGIGVMAPNFRGSNGYGLQYQRLIYRDWGGGELRDVDAGARFVEALPEVLSPLAVMGGSFGGFLTLSCLARLPEHHWACGVDLVGPSDLVTFVQTVPPSWRRMTDELIGNPERDADFLRSRSPITYLDRVQAPLLVLQGANDPRVNRQESDALVQQLQARGLPVEYVVYDHEGHGFAQRANMEDAYCRAYAFILRYLVSQNREA